MYLDGKTPLQVTAASIPFMTNVQKNGKTAEMAGLALLQ
jgi:hypothetical protein